MKNKQETMNQLDNAIELLEHDVLPNLNQAAHECDSCGLNKAEVLTEYMAARTITSVIRKLSKTYRELSK